MFLYFSETEKHILNKIVKKHPKTHEKRTKSVPSFCTLFMSQAHKIAAIYLVQFHVLF